MISIQMEVYKDLLEKHFSDFYTDAQILQYYNKVPLSR